jgi:hypothetical protein
MTVVRLLRTLGVSITWLFVIVVALGPAGAQPTPPKQQDGGAGGGLPRPRPGTQQPPATSPPATTPPATSPPQSTPPPASPPAASSDCLLSVKHWNGIGQTFCNTLPIGTISRELAVAASKPWPGASFPVDMPCPGGSAVSAKTPTMCAVWGYSGSIAGRVNLNPTNNTCTCPTQNSRDWR